MKSVLLPAGAPVNYFKGKGTVPLPVPVNILVFTRTSRRTLQQEALHDRSHHRFVLMFNLETAGSVHINHLTFQLKPKQALTVFPYQFHHYSHLKSSTLKWLFCTFVLSAGTFFEPLRNCPLPVNRRIHQQLMNLLAEWRRAGAGNPEETVQAALLQLLLLLKEQCRNPAPAPVPENNLFRTINRILAEQQRAPVTVENIAAAFHLSASRMRTLFRENAGIPLGSYIQNYRINRAMELLRTSQLSIADVAGESGFTSLQSFSRAFKTATGKSPKAYRNSLPQ